MCMEDWAIMRQAKAIVHSATIGNGSIIVIPANSQRIAIYFPVDINAGTIIGINRLPSQTDYDICPQLNQPPIFTLLNSGNLCQQSFQITYTGATATSGTWIEVVLPESMLSVPLSKITDPKYGAMRHHG